MNQVWIFGYVFARLFYVGYPKSFYNVILILLKKFFIIQLFCYPFKFVIYIFILNEFNIVRMCFGCTNAFLV